MIREKKQISSRLRLADRQAITGSDGLWSIFPFRNKKEEIVFKKYECPTRAVLYTSKKRIDLITGNEQPLSWPLIVQEIKEHLNEIKVGQKYKLPRVIHFYYESHFCFHHVDNKNLPKAEMDILLDIEFEKSSWCDLKWEENETRPHLIGEWYKTVHFQEYKKAFDTCFQELLQGNSYQLNLTFPSIFKIKNISSFSPLQFVKKIWENTRKIGNFAHATYIPNLNKLIVSNTPECLFKIQQEQNSFTLSSMPIKGTLPLSPEQSITQVWKKLLSDKKNRGELLMITDLIRNDLTQIELGPSKVIRKNAPLVVPGLLHQYSHVQADIGTEITLLQIIKSLFPGGSITGAPKLKTIEILNRVEKLPRGLYCGTTVLIDHCLRAGSINIRTANIDYRKSQLLYNSGGGITLLSKAKSEFEELNAKRESFITLCK